MSQPPGPPQARIQKTMSSRLLTMKFMQRAAASSNAPSPDSKTPPSKRQKITTPSSTPAPLSDLEAVKGALKAEENRKLEALERLAADAGETKWVLSYVNGGEGDGKGVRGLQVLTTGYSEIDHRDGSTGYGQEGRRSFGKFNRELEKCQTGTAEKCLLSSDEALEAGDETDDQGGEDPADASELIRESRNTVTQQAGAIRKAEFRAKLVESERMGKMKRGNEVNLKRLSSISGGGGSSGRSGSGANENAAQGNINRNQSNGKRKYEFDKNVGPPSSRRRP